MSLNYFKNKLTTIPELLEPYTDDFNFTHYEYIPTMSFLKVLEIIKIERRVILGGMLCEKLKSRIDAEGSNWAYDENDPEVSYDKAIQFYEKIKNHIEINNQKNYYIELIVKE